MAAGLLIELNADVGEGAVDDAALLGLVQRANIACGWHAGDGASMLAALRACRAQGVLAGAHPSFPDRAGFGRQSMQRAPEAVQADLIAQIAGLRALAAREGLRLDHVKPHGALYNQAAVDPELAAAVAAAVREVDPDLALVGLAGSELLRAGRAQGLRVLAEAFADRAYLADGRLAPRQRSGALLHEPEAVCEQALALACGRPIRSLDGPALSVRADTLCLHGDGPDALGLARRLHSALLSRATG